MNGHAEQTCLDNNSCIAHRVKDSRCLLLPTRDSIERPPPESPEAELDMLVVSRVTEDGN